MVMHLRYTSFDTLDRHPGRLSMKKWISMFAILSQFKHKRSTESGNPCFKKFSTFKSLFSKLPRLILLILGILDKAKVAIESR